MNRRGISVAVFLGVFLLLAGSALARRPNVLLITVDTFRPDHLGAYGYSRNTSPALDRFAHEGVLFQNAISSASWTSPGLISVLTGLWAPTHGVDVRGKSLRPGTPTMATLLRKAGYSAPDILYLSSIPNFYHLGLTESYRDKDLYMPKGDQVLFHALEAYRDSTFFLYYHYRNLHLPYNPSSPYDRMFTPKGFDRSGFVRHRVKVVRSNVTIPVGSLRLEPSDRSWIVGLYDGEVREMDDTFFRPLFAELKRLGLDKNTLVIVTADHGEELMDHGFIGHPSTSFKGSAYDEVLRIPLMMRCPGLIPAGRVVKMQVQNVDILPTVMDLLGLPVPKTVQGRSLVPAIRGEPMTERPAFTETTPGGYQATQAMLSTRLRAMRTLKWKLIYTHGPGMDRYQLFDLVQDPKEQEDVSAEHPKVLARMKAALSRWILETQPRPVAAALPAAQGKVSKPVRVLFPADRDSFRYADVGESVSVRWSGPADASYTIEYRVGKGNYYLEGTIPVQGDSARYGPYTEEMWNMLSLYNPWTFRVTVPGRPGLDSPWVHFTVVPTRAAVPRGRWATFRAIAGTWWNDAALLVGGLWLGVLDLLRMAGNIRPVDLVSVGLMLAILAGLFRSWLARLGPERIRRWGAALLYVAFIYSTLSAMPVVWRTLWAYTKGRVDYLGMGVPILAGVAILIYLVLWHRRWPSFLLFPPLAACYVYLLLHLGRSPAERLHLAEYGLVSFLVFRALRVDMSLHSAYFWGWLIASCLGGIDECLQGVIPDRVFEWKDIAVNVAASGLGIGVVALLIEPWGRSKAEEKGTEDEDAGVREAGDG